MEWLKRISLRLGFRDKVRVFVSYSWQNDNKIGYGNSVLEMDRMPSTWEDMLTIKKNIADTNLKDYPGVQVMIIHYCNMG